MATGLAMFFPAMAVPVLRVPGSNIAYCEEKSHIFNISLGDNEC
jgi:hypothetical protein